MLTTRVSKRKVDRGERESREGYVAALATISPGLQERFITGYVAGATSLENAK